MGTPRPILLSPTTPSALLTFMLTHTRYPTTLIIAWPKSQFLQALTLEVKHEQAQDEQPHQLSLPTLLQTAISRHIRLLFTPTLTHLRAILSTLTSPSTRIRQPPDHVETQSLLIVYGFLDVHRMTSEWSAQGIGTSAAALVDAATRTGLTGVIIEPRGVGSCEDLDELLSQKMPLLTGMELKDNGSWAGRGIEVQRVLGRWFEVKEQEW